MRPQIARGFVAMMIRTEDIDRVNQEENKFPSGRYWIPSEIGYFLKKSLKKLLTEDQINSMEETWINFCKSKNIDQEETIGDHSVALDWMLYAHKNYSEPLFQVSKSYEID